MTTPSPGSPDEEHYRFARFMGVESAVLIELFDKHHLRLFRYCLRFVGERERAEDLMQDLWERVIRLCIAGRVGSDDPTGLLWTMARNICLDELRRESRQVPLDDLPETSHPMTTIPEPSRLEELLQIALPRLSEGQRQVLLLHTESGYRFEEIAEMLGEPVGAVKTRAWRARTNLRRIISTLIGIDEGGAADVVG